MTMHPWREEALDFALVSALVAGVGFVLFAVGRWL